ncbi:lytic transglycosylase domain-containing protein [Roseovarius faecimaris]|uniref:Lytic transglycosylase domain-containing protein n=2 Tax=Roseovarius faecimaris TaxID=2494550 RepID=A0A6I6IWH7_9RHOB|nr:lytic transglycosylase domain-containing protein [Roseovarius faecimaris]
MRLDRILCLGLILALGTPVMAGDPPPFPDFTFKMAKPPKKGAAKRIMVQIEPQVHQPKPKPTETVSPTPSAPVPATYAWFWSDVPSEIGVNGADRMRKALAGLNKAPGGGSIPGPRLQDLQGIASAQGSTILRETIGTDVSPALVLAVIAVESSGRDTAESHKGAQGLMQLMPDTAKRFGVEDSLEPAQNIKGGVAYLNWLMREFDGDAVLALAGYNAGENAVKKHQGVPPYAETRDYIPKVLAAFEVARGLCKTRPELVTDACALNLAMN